jgi:hypothetical protein
VIIRAPSSSHVACRPALSLEILSDRTASLVVCGPKGFRVRGVETTGAPVKRTSRWLRIDLRCEGEHPRADVGFHDVRTDLNLILSTRHRLDMNSSKSWSSESKRHSKAYVKVAAIEAPGPGAAVNTRELGADTDQPDG